MKYILALDQGTTSSRAVIFDHNGEIVARAQQEFPQVYPRSGWVEHNPSDILSSQVGVIAEAFVRAGVTGKDIAAVGITNQRETTLVWDRKTGKPVYNAIVWQCRRTADYCDLLRQQGCEQLIYDKTGLVLDAYFSATKLKWILDNIAGVRTRAEKGELCFGTVDTYLMWHLSKGKIFATDYTNAARTMLFNIHTLRWDDDLLQLFDIPACMLPEVKPSGYMYGYADVTMLGAKVPICSVVGDQQAALFGQLCVEVGSMKNTFGTGCFMLMNTGDKPVRSQGLVTTLAAGTDWQPQYALEGSVFMGGAIVQWLRDEMRLIHQASDSERYAMRVKNTNGVYIVPAFVGLGAPYWDSKVRGTVFGLTRGATKEHFVRAALESIAYQVYDVAKAMEQDLGSPITSLNVDGGGSANNFLMQFQADILQTNVVRPKVIETTALGACYLAGLTVGYWRSTEEIKRNKKIERTFVPTMDQATRLSLVQGWADCIRRARLG